MAASGTNFRRCDAQGEPSYRSYQMLMEIQSIPLNKTFFEHEPSYRYEDDIPCSIVFADRVKSTALVPDAQASFSRFGIGKCGFCGTFFNKSSKINKYCSRECAGLKSYTPRPPRGSFCHWCGGYFLTSPPMRHYCSAACRKQSKYQRLTAPQMNALKRISIFDCKLRRDGQFWFFELMRKTSSRKLCFEGFVNSMICRRLIIKGYLGIIKLKRERAWELFDVRLTRKGTEVLKSSAQSVDSPTTS